ncbi:hypothetical protein Tco_1288454 [Tanacetum coccineum]
MYPLVVVLCTLCHTYSRRHALGCLFRLDLIWGCDSEDFQEYSRAIPNTMLTKEIKPIKAYQTIIKYSTRLIPPKKSRCKRSQGKKSVVTPKPASVEVSDESDPEPAKRQTGSRRSRGVVIQGTPNVPKKKSVDHS